MISDLPMAELRRSFIDVNIFLVCDDLEALDNSLHEYSGLYQFGVFNASSASVNNTTHGFVIQRDRYCGYDKRID